MSIGDLYEAVVDDAAWASLPATAARMVGARSCVLHEIEADGLVNSRASYLSDDWMARLARVHPDGRDIWVAVGLGSGVVGRAVLVDDLLSDAGFLRSPLWNDVVRWSGDDTGRSMGMTLPLDGGLLLLTFQRAFGAGAFRRRQLAQFDAIAPDLHRIHRARRLLGQRAGQAARMEALLTGTRTRALLVGPGLAVLAASPDAQALLDAADGLRLWDGRLRTTDPALAGPLRASVDATVRHLPGGQVTFRCSRRDGAPPWRVLVLPAPAGVRGCMILIRGGEEPGDRRRLWLAQQHGATAAEIAVAEALLAGGAPEAVAVARGVSLHTIRTQIRRLLEKTGAGGISALLVELARLG